MAQIGTETDCYPRGNYMDHRTLQYKSVEFSRSVLAMVCSIR